MKYLAKDKSGNEKELTEQEVRGEIIETLQHDMGVMVEMGSDEAIAKGVNESDLADYFDNNEFEYGWNYETIKRVAEKDLVPSHIVSQIV